MYAHICLSVYFVSIVSSCIKQMSLFVPLILQFNVASLYSAVPDCPVLISPTKEWKAVVVLIGKTGRDGLKRRVSEFAVESLQIEVAMRAKELLGLLDLNEVRAVSSGAATFYVWVGNIVHPQHVRTLIPRFKQVV